MAVYLALMIWTRFVNLDHTARFIWDESSDLVRMHQIWVEKRVTLVGPISEDGQKVFSSLGYYLLMPAVVGLNFDPVAQAMGVAWWKVFATALWGIVVVRYFKKNWAWGLILGLVWLPWISSSQWAAHVSFIPLWVTLSMWCGLKGGRLGLVGAGLFGGLVVHAHYLGVYPILAWGAILSWKNRRSWNWVWWGVGFGLALAPFVVFDLTHRPPLFWTRIKYFNRTDMTWLAHGAGIQKLVDMYVAMFSSWTGEQFWAVVLAIGSGCVLVSEGLSMWAWPWLAQVAGLLNAYYDGASPHYFLAAGNFYMAWLLKPRTGKLRWGAYGLMTIWILVMGSRMYATTHVDNWRTNIASIRQIVNVIADDRTKNAGASANLAVLGSDDPNIYGRQFRDVLLVRGVNLRSKDEYHVSDNLYVITTSNEQAIRQDPAVEMADFRKGKLTGYWAVSESKWRIYKFDRN